MRGTPVSPSLPCGLAILTPPTPTRRLAPPPLSVELLLRDRLSWAHGVDAA